MNREIIVQVPMEAAMKEQVEELYQEMGLNFAEAVRMFAAQSLLVRGLPFRPVTEKPLSSVHTSGLAGSLSRYATPERLEKEEEKA